MGLTQDLILNHDQERMMDREEQSRHRPLKPIDLPMFILDVLRYDIEPRESILNLLNDDGCIGWRQFWPRPFTIEDVVPQLDKLVQNGLVDVYQVNTDQTELEHVEKARIDVIAKSDLYWYLLTKNGRIAWDKWEPPIIDENEG